MNMNENFKISKVNVTVLHKIQSVNGNLIPGYTKVAKAIVYFEYNDSKYRTNIYTLINEPIDIECSVRQYYSDMRDCVAEEIFNMCPTYEELKKYQKEMNNLFNK